MTFFVDKETDLPLVHQNPPACDLESSHRQSSPWDTESQLEEKGQRQQLFSISVVHFQQCCIGSVTFVLQFTQQAHDCVLQIRKKNIMNDN